MKVFFTLLFSLTLAIGTLQASGPFYTFSGSESFANLTVYPNPSNTGNFSVKFEMVNNQEAVKVKVYNLVGRQVYQNQIKSQDGSYFLDFSVSTLPKGVYMLEVSQGDNRMTRRLSFI